MERSHLTVPTATFRALCVLFALSPLRDGEGSRKMRNEKTTELVKDAVGMVQGQMVGQTKDDKAGVGEVKFPQASVAGCCRLRGRCLPLSQSTKTPSKVGGLYQRCE
jgi:hypothetical protein